MNFLRDFLSTSTKTDEDLDLFINKKFAYYLNNSNLLLNFVSDFEDYKNNGRNDNKSKCDECESLYILTSEIFENYINRVKIPFDITIYSEGKVKSNINYNNKVLYFFDIKDLNKILQSKNLARSSEDTKLLTKKRILCKIVSLSFIKIYIIIKSIFQTFNIYGSLIKNKTTGALEEARYPISGQGELYEEEKESQESSPEQELEQFPDRVLIPPPEQVLEPPPERVLEQPPEQVLEQPQERVLEPPPERVLEQPPERVLEPPPERILEQPPERVLEPPPQQKIAGENTSAENTSGENTSGDNTQGEEKQPNFQDRVGGANFFDFINPFSNDTTNSQNEVPPDEYQRAIKLQISNNIFYSLFLILFKNEEFELTTKTFTPDYLTKKVDSMTKEKLAAVLPDILKYICHSKLNPSKFISKSSIIFNDDNFKFLKLKTSDTLEHDATFYLKELDKVDAINKKNNIDNDAKLIELEKSFTKKNQDFVKNYCDNNNMNLSDINILSSVKRILKKMITNYFTNRNILYNKIIKNLIKFNAKTNEIENIIPSLTYIKIVELTEKTKDILLSLHIDIYKSLNSIISEIRSNYVHKYGNQQLEQNQQNKPTFIGGKTRKKYYKKSKKYTRK
jgi:hypothetical protein